MPIQYIVYDYHTSGSVREITYVMRAQTGAEPFFYTWKTAYSDDINHPEKTGETEKSLVRKKDVLWLPKMLKTSR
jgi:hypothetical protein